jgi:two-component system cell cycle response regulator
VSRAHARVVTRGDQVFIEDLNSSNGTYINGTRLSAPTKLSSGDKIQVGHATILKFTYQDSLDDSYQKQIFDASLRDGLTQIFNARYIMDRLNSELQFAMRQGSTLGMILFDIDRLKRVNEAYGRASGDKALFEIAQLIARSLRTEDVVARYGSDELIVLVRGIPRAHVLAAADRLRQVIHQLAIDVEVAKILLSVSAGVATYPEAAVTSPMEMIGVANQALQRAKQGGRNRIEG